MSKVWSVHRALDTALDLAVAPGYSAIGYQLRGLSWDDAVAGRLTRCAAVVTGASSGIGEAAAEGLARAGARVHLLVRNLERGERARARIQERLPSPADLRLLVCDLADLAAVAHAAAELRAGEPDLAVLVNNAGVLVQERERTASGAELTFATNVLGPFALTELLLPTLRASGHGRVINVSSGGMYTARLHGDDLQLDRRDFDGPAFYAHTKRAEVVLTELWASREDERAEGGDRHREGERAEGDDRHRENERAEGGDPHRENERAEGDGPQGERGVVFAAMHPGWADTAGLRRSLPRFRKLARPVLRDEHQAADTIVWLATAPAGDVPNGRLWHDRRSRPTHRLPGTRESQDDRRALWQACRRLTAATRTKTPAR